MDTLVVGGFNPKNIRHIGSFSPGTGENTKYLRPPSSNETTLKTESSLDIYIYIYIIYSSTVGVPINGELTPCNRTICHPNCKVQVVQDGGNHLNFQINFIGHKAIITSLKIQMKPENHPLWKRNIIFQTSISGFHCSILVFRSVFFVAKQNLRDVLFV